jgi:hypothetical protein
MPWNKWGVLKGIAWELYSASVKNCLENRLKFWNRMLKNNSKYVVGVWVGNATEREDQ